MRKSRLCGIDGLVGGGEVKLLEAGLHAAGHGGGSGKLSADEQLEPLGFLAARTTSLPLQHPALQVEDPGDAGLAKELAGGAAAVAAATVDDGVPGGVDLVQPLRQFIERDEDGAGDVGLLVFLGLADIDELEVVRRQMADIRAGLCGGDFPAMVEQ